MEGLAPVKVYFKLVDPSGVSPIWPETEIFYALERARHRLRQLRKIYNSKGLKGDPYIEKVEKLGNNYRHTDIETGETWRSIYP